MKQKITDYLDEIYGGTFTATHLQKLVTRLESAKRLITQRRKKHWDESDVVLPLPFGEGYVMYSATISRSVNST